MITFAAVAIVVAFGFGVLVWKWKRGATSIVLGALPVALWFLVLPIPPAIFGMIRGFQQISESGSAGIVQAGALCLNISRPLFLGSIGFVLVLAAATVLEMRGGAEESDDEEASTGATSVTEMVVLVSSSLLVFPAVGVIHLTASVPRLVMSAATRLNASPEAVAAAGSSSLAETSALISSRLVSSMLAGSLLSLLLVIAAVACLVALRSRNPPRWLTTYSRVVWVICLLLAVWNAIQLNLDIRSFELAIR